MDLLHTKNTVTYFSGAQRRHDVSVTYVVGAVHTHNFCRHAAGTASCQYWRERSVKESCDRTKSQQKDNHIEFALLRVLLTSTVTPTLQAPKNCSLPLSLVWSKKPQRQSVFFPDGWRFHKPKTLKHEKKKTPSTEIKKQNDEGLQHQDPCRIRLPTKAVPSVEKVVCFPSAASGVNSFRRQAHRSQEASWQ